MMKTGNLFENIPGTLPEELVEVLAEGNGKIKIERIISRAHSSPPGFWYNQESTEWVTLLKGTAILLFEEGTEKRELNPGDWIEIPANTRHRVESTSPDEDSIWLAIHWAS